MLEPIAEKTCWSEIKHKIKALNPAFYENLDAVNPSDDMRLLIVKYPYGYKLSDEKAFYMPKGYEDYMEGSGFDRKAPLTFVLENKIQYYFDTLQNHVLWHIFSPGEFFPGTILTEHKGEPRFHPKSIFSVTSGIRDITQLSLHGTTNDFYHLRRKYKIPVEMSPANPLNHFDIFKHIIEEEGIEWYSTVLIFGSEWKHKAHNDPKWRQFYVYLLENSVSKHGGYRNTMFFDHAIYDITRSLDFKFRPYTHEIIHHIILTATGTTPGFRPANNNHGFPLDEVSEALKNSSRELLSYPIFMQADMMLPENKEQFIYSSITYNTSTKYEHKSNPNTYLNEIMLHLNDYLLNFTNHLITKGTVYDSLYDSLEIIPCSTRGSEKFNIKKTIDMYEMDNAFWYSRDILNYNARYGAPINAQFCKGFFGIRWIK